MKLILGVMIVVSLIAFRLMWPPFGPKIAKNTLLPRKWRHWLQHWIVGESRK
jgi:cytochrome b